MADDESGAWSSSDAPSVQASSAASVGRGGARPTSAESGSGALAAFEGAVEAHAAALEAALRRSAVDLASARQEAAAARAAREPLAAELVRARRAQREAAQRRAVLERALREAEASIAEQRRSCHGLRRTLSRFCELAGVMSHETSESLASAASAERVEHDAEIEVASLAQEAEGLEEISLAMHRRAVAEREKRLRLKACARLRLQKLAEDQAMLRSAASERLAELGPSQQEAEEAEVRAQAALEEVAERRQVLASEEARAAERSRTEQELQLELMRLRQMHGQMYHEIQAIDAEIAERVQRRRAACVDRCQRHMARTDAKVQRMRQLDEDVLVAAIGA